MSNILLVEPNYKNKYPPVGLMKLATYYRTRGDNVRFYKGDMKLLAVELICDDLIKQLTTVDATVFWKQHSPILFNFIRLGRYSLLDELEPAKNESILSIIKEYRLKYKNKEYFTHPKYDKVGITTLFTFYWKQTIETINFAKQLCKNPDNVMVGGIMSTLLPNEVYKATGIHPYVGLLDKPGIIDADDDRIIDHLPLDYSILDEIDYVYPASNAYIAYMTRGCPNKCPFCAVPTLEPEYCDYISLKDQIEYTREHFGEQKDLLLMDNNVLASEDFDKIVDEIIECGFGRGATYTPSNEYEVAIRNLRQGYNDRAYIKKTVKLHRKLHDHLPTEEANALFEQLENSYCHHEYTATKEKILELDEYIAPLYARTFRPTARKRIIDFNQGIEGKLVTEANMEKLAQTNIYPLRIAFDHWSLEQVYKRAIHIAVTSGIKNLSNYMLYNFQDKPDDLYNRLRVTVDMCDSLKANIYSFPMKFHPINDPEYFMNRDYIGKHWNRKFIRAIQAILNSTKGKIGKGIPFFEEAFGRNLEEFNRLLWMPETFIIYRRQYDESLRNRLADKYVKKYGEDSDLANIWWKKFNELSPEQLEKAKSIIALNHFKDGEYFCDDKKVEEILDFYKITRNEAEHKELG